MLVFSRVGFSDSYVRGLVFLRLMVSNSYVRRIVFLRLGVSNCYVSGHYSYVCGLVILTFWG